MQNTAFALKGTLRTPKCVRSEDFIGYDRFAFSDAV